MKNIYNFLFLYFIVTTSFAQHHSDWEWARQSTGRGVHEGIGLAVDPFMNVFLAGYYNDSLVFNNSTVLLGYWNPFLSKFDKDGNFLWARGGITDSSGVCHTTSVVTDKFGNAIICGNFNSNQVSFNSITLIKSINTTSLSTDSYITSYDSSGTVRWAINLGNMHRVSLNAMTTDINGNIYVTGGFNDTAFTYAGQTLNQNGFQTGFVGKFDASGNLIWLHGFNCDFSASGQSICIDKWDDVIVGGNFAGNFYCANDTLNSLNDQTFIIKMDQNGNEIWAIQSLGAVSFLSDLTTDKDSGIYITGLFQGAQFQIQNQIVNGIGPGFFGSYMDDAFIAKINTNGVINWIKTVSGNDDEKGFSLTTDNSGVFFSGHFQSDTVYIEGNSYVFSTRQDNSFIIKYDNNSLITCLDFFPFGGDDINDLAADYDDNIYWGGDFYGLTNYLLNNDSLNSTSSIGELLFISKFQCKGLGTNYEVSPSLNDFTVYPNPSNGSFKVDGLSTGLITIYNYLGSVVYCDKKTSENISIDLQQLNNGIYLFTLTNSKKVFKTKVNIIH